MPLAHFHYSFATLVADTQKLVVSVHCTGYAILDYNHSHIALLAVVHSHSHIDSAVAIVAVVELVIACRYIHFDFVQFDSNALVVAHTAVSFDCLHIAFADWDMPLHSAFALLRALP